MLLLFLALLGFLFLLLYLSLALLYFLRCFADELVLVLANLFELDGLGLLDRLRRRVLVEDECLPFLPLTLDDERTRCSLRLARGPTYLAIFQNRLPLLRDIVVLT